MKKVAIISSHPIQYNAPWFRFLAKEADLDIKVFYLWDFGVASRMDAGFRQTIQWDVPLLSGYEYEFVPNKSSEPGTHHFWGLNNPSLFSRVRSYDPDVVLMFGYNYAAFYQFLLRWDSRRAPILFRGDSHRLAARVAAKELIRRKVISLIFQRFSGFLYVGKANYEYFRYHQVPAEKLFFAPHAVDNARFSEAGQASEQA